MAHVQSAHNEDDASGASLAATLGSAATAGNTIIVVVGFDFTLGGISTITDGLGNSYALIDAVNGTVDDTTNSTRTSVYIAHNIKGGSLTVTATYTTSLAFRRITVSEFSGIHPFQPVGYVSTSRSHITTSGGTDGTTSNSLSPAYNNSEIVGVIVLTDGSSPTISAGTGFTELTETPIASPQEIESLTQGVAATVSATWTLSAGGNSANIVAFSLNPASAVYGEFATFPKRVPVLSAVAPAGAVRA